MRTAIHKKNGLNKKLMGVIVFLSFFLSSFAQDISEIDSLKNQFQDLKSDSLKVVTAIDLSRKMHRKDMDEREEFYYAELAIDYSLRFENKHLYAKALDNLGLLYRFHQYYAESLDFHIKAFKTIEDEDGPLINKMIYANNAGVAARYSMKNDVAIAYYMKALEIAESEKDLKNIAIASNGIGNTLGNISGREMEALSYFEKSLNAEKERDNKLGMSMNYLSIAGHYIDNKEFSKARDYLNILKNLNIEIDNQFGLAITDEFFGISYLKENKDLNKATTYFHRAFDQFKIMKNRHKQAEILVNLGRVHQNQHNPEAAEKCFQESLALSLQIKDFNLIKDNSYLLSQVNEESDHLKEALEYYKQAKVYEDSLKLYQQKVSIEALTRKYDLKKKEDEIELLQKDRNLQEAKLSHQDEVLKQRFVLLILMGVGLLMLLVIFFLQYRNSKLRKKSQAKLIEGEKEKMKVVYQRDLARAEILVTRLQINPHFLFNSLNAITYLIQSRQNAKAKKYLVVFSRYTRMVLETSRNQTISLEEELKLTRYYLILEENRFEKGFVFTIEGEESPYLHDIQIPPMLLQPFVENAIWHGLLPSRKDKKELKIKVIPDGEKVEIHIDDNGVGREFSRNRNRNRLKTEHKSMGMEIIQERIDLYNKSFGGEIDFDIIDKKDKAGNSDGTRVVFHINSTVAELQVGSYL